MPPGLATPMRRRSMNMMAATTTTIVPSAGAKEPRFLGRELSAEYFDLGGSLRP
jgi:hypothetical protein